MSNMELWDKVCTTDPDCTKRVAQRGGFTAIDAYSQIQKATELWGSMGNKWGVSHECFEDIDNGLLIYSAGLFYPGDNDVRGEIPIHSSINMVQGAKLDGDCVKKVATDALTKGLSKLGFNADVFLGKFDDNKYVAELKKETKPNHWDELVKVKKDFPDETQQAVLLLGLDLKGKLPKDILPADCSDIVKEVHRLVDQKEAA